VTGELPLRAYYVAAGITLGMLAYGVLAGAILVVTRRRAERGTWLRALLVVGVTVLFILLMAAGWISVALGAPPEFTGMLLTLGAMGFVAEQLVIMAWIGWMAWRAKRGAPPSE
jgi:heme A synthase